MPAVPETVCAPDGLDLDPYLHILRWFLEDGEALRSVAFPYQVGTHNFAGVLPTILAKRVDATWDALAPGRVGSLVEKFAPSAFVAVTNRRIVTAHPGNLLRRGELGPIYRLNDVQYVRPRSSRVSVRPTIDVTTEQRDIHWMFPHAAAHEDIDSLAAILSEQTLHAIPVSEAIEQSFPARAVTDA